MLCVRSRQVVCAVGLVADIEVEAVLFGMYGTVLVGNVRKKLAI